MLKAKSVQRSPVLQIQNIDQTCIPTGGCPNCARRLNLNNPLHEVKEGDFAGAHQQVFEAGKVEETDNC